MTFRKKSFSYLEIFRINWFGFDWTRSKMEHFFKVFLRSWHWTKSTHSSPLKMKNITFGTKLFSYFEIFRIGRFGFNWIWSKMKHFSKFSLYFFNGFTSILVIALKCTRSLLEKNHFRILRFFESADLDSIGYGQKWNIFSKFS